MATIKLLDESIINKIAAGEVVENPKSIVKEMVENSIDAGATKITVEIKDGGKELIRISDNGKGINKDEVEVAFLRHATSKISKSEDLYEILTLGFRGEALSSISEVSKVRLVTKTAEDMTGTSIVVEGGNTIEKIDIGCNVGTTFTIEDLFYNVPARRKFLKSTRVESSYIYDLINGLALSKPNISFKLISNGTVVLQSSGNGSLQHILYQIYGKKIVENIYEIKSENEVISLDGYIADPIKNNRANKKYGTFILNGRYIKSDLMYSAVKDAIGDNLMNGKYPIFCLNINMKPGDIDINVHPNKLEVRFSNEKLVYDFIYETIKKAFTKNSILINDKPNERESFLNITNSKSYKIDKNEDIYNFVKSENKLDYSLNKNNIVIANDSKVTEEVKPTKKVLVDSYSNKNKEEVEKKHISSTKGYDEKNEVKLILKDESTNEKVVEDIKRVEQINFKFIGQLFNTYCVIEKDNNIYLIDQHAAHEKVTYEKILLQLKNTSVQSQILLQPMSIVLNDNESKFLLDNIEIFKKFGFDIQEFGKNTFAIRGVPLLFSNPVGVDFFNDILELLMKERKKIESIYDLKLDKVASVACKASVKANTYLSEKEVKDLINQMLLLNSPNTCPHGRPTMIEVSKKEIDKMFKRIL